MPSFLNILNGRADDTLRLPFDRRLRVLIRNRTEDILHPIETERVDEVADTDLSATREVPAS